MKRAGRVIQWSLTNAVFICLVVAGTVYGIAPAWNVARFGIVFFAIASTAIACHPPSKKEFEKKGRPVPRGLSLTSDWVVILCLAATGHFAFAAVHAWQSLMEQTIYLKTPEKTGVAS